MTEVDYLAVGFLIYSLLDVVSFCRQNERISKLEWELRELKTKKDGAKYDR